MDTVLLHICNKVGAMVGNTCHKAVYVYDLSATMNSRDEAYHESIVVRADAVTGQVFPVLLKELQTLEHRLVQ